MCIEIFKFPLSCSSKSLHKLTRFSATRRNVKFMINMARMLSKKEWVVEVVAMTHLTSSNLSLAAATHLVVSFPYTFQFWSSLLSVIWTIFIDCGYCFWAPGGGSSRGRRQRRGEDVIHPLKVSLEDLYNGTSKKLSLSRNVICSKCKGLVFICMMTSCFRVIIGETKCARKFGEKVMVPNIWF